MNVASLDLCKELYELSGWNDKALAQGRWDFAGPHEDMPPPYDLGYLLRKLPSHSAILKLDNTYLATADPTDADLVSSALGHQNTADTPEDAAAKLAIELFKQGILTKGDK